MALYAIWTLQCPRTFLVRDARYNQWLGVATTTVLNLPRRLHYHLKHA